MKKTFSKIISAILVLALALGAMSFNVFAAEETTVEIISNNVKIDDHVRLMYAVDATNLEEGDEIVVELTNSGETLRAVRTEDETVKGKECAIFVSAKGVAPFDIAEEFTAVAKVVRDGEVIATSAPTTYSVLEYIYEWLLVTGKDDPDYAATLKALYAYAVASEKCFLKTEEITNLAYVRVAENGAFNGKTAGMVKVGTTLAELTTTLVAGENQFVVWNTVSYGTNFVETDTSTLSDEAAKELKAADGAIILTPTLSEIEEPEAEPVTITTDCSSLSAPSDGATVKMDNVITFKYTKGAIDSVPLIKNSDYLLLYQNNSGKSGGNGLVFTAANGYKILSIELTINSSGQNAQNGSTMIVTGGTVSKIGSTKNLLITADGSEVSFYLNGTDKKNDRLWIDSITVTYIAE